MAKNSTLVFAFSMKVLVQVVAVTAVVALAITEVLVQLSSTAARVHV
jgi:hypothetical protein